MKKIKLSKKELVIIDLLIFILFIKFAYEPVIKSVSPEVQVLVDRSLLFIWLIVGILLLTFCFSNLFSAIQILINRRKVNKDSEEYIYKTQEYFIKFNNAKYFAKIFIFIIFLFNSLFIMSVIFLVYNLFLSFKDMNSLKFIHSTEKEYNETVYKINSEIQNISLYSIIINMSYFYLQYNSSIFKYSQNNNDLLNRFLLGILIIVLQIIIYFIFIRKIINSSNRITSINRKLLLSIIYAISSFSLLNVLIYYLSHWV